MDILKCADILSECGIDTSVLIIEHLAKTECDSLSSMVRALGVLERGLCVRLQSLSEKGIVRKEKTPKGGALWSLTPLGRLQASHARAMAHAVSSPQHSVMLTS